MDSGSVTISVEIELGWGQHDNKNYDLLSPGRTAETTALKEILESADRNEIPITFDIVGHLFLNTCNGTHNGPYSPDWFSEDPGTNTESHPHFYAPDLVQLVQNATVDHEIGTHTFSHIICEDADPELLDHELKQVREIHSDVGLSPPSSFVPPRHSIPNHEILTKNEINAIRMPNPTHVGDNIDMNSSDNIGITTNNSVIPVGDNGEKIKRLRKWATDRGHNPRQPQETNGVFETYSTPYPSLTAVHLRNGQQEPRDLFQRIPLKIRQKIHERYLMRGLKAAQKSNTNAHYWTHLLNAANEQQLSPIKSFFESLGRQAETGDIDILTMKKLQARYMEKYDA